MSLVEMLLACALFLLVGSLVMQVLLPMAPGLLRGSQQASLQQTAFLAADRMAREIEQTTYNSMELLDPAPGEPPVRFAMRPLAGVGAGGGQVLANEAIVYWWDSTASQLWRATWTNPNAPGSPELLPNSTDFDAVLASPPPTARVLAGGVTKTQVALRPGGGQPATEISLQLNLYAPAQDSRPPETFAIQRTVVLHNTDYLP